MSELADGWHFIQPSPLSLGKLAFLGVPKVKRRAILKPLACFEQGLMPDMALLLIPLPLPFASQTNEWNKNDDRLLQAVENGDAEKVASLLGKKGASATKHDSEGKTA